MIFFYKLYNQGIREKIIFHLKSFFMSLKNKCLNDNVQAYTFKMTSITSNGLKVQNKSFTFEISVIL